MINLDDDPTTAPLPAPPSSVVTHSNPWDALSLQEERYTAELSRLTCNALKSRAKAASTRQNYKGTGSRAYRRQVWVRFHSGAVIDLWLGDSGANVTFGGVVCNRAPGAQSQCIHRKVVSLVRDGELVTTSEAAAQITDILNAWANQ